MTTAQPRVVVATGNAGKVREFQHALHGMGIDLIAANQLGVTSWPPEDAPDYAGNATIKALHASRATGLPALADDSGIEVDALGGAPGVHSAHFGGPGLDDEGRTALLLKRLHGVAREHRKARFRSVIVLATPSGDTWHFEGQCEGIILTEPAGADGFGYDPVFHSLELGLSFGDATLEQKRSVSHRGKALGALKTWLHAQRPGLLEDATLNGTIS